MHRAPWRSTAAVAVLVAVTAGACSGGTAAVAPPGQATAAIAPVFAEVAPGEAAALIESRLGEPDFALLDVRTPDEFAGGHLAGAENLDFYAASFADQIGALDRNAEYVVYCRSGNRSGQTVELMRQLGFTNVTDVSGGIARWQAEGLPVTTG